MFLLMMPVGDLWAWSHRRVSVIMFVGAHWARGGAEDVLRSHDDVYAGPWYAVPQLTGWDRR